MTNSKNTKRALLLSVLSMMLCVAMLIGSTFAWFTDSVTSGKNRIVAGNLDVELYHSNGNVTDEKVEVTTNLFTDKDGNAILWEPGVMVYENFTVKNVGSLALKYCLTVNAGNFNTIDGKSLKDVLKVAVLDGAFTGDRAAAQALTFDATIADFEKSGNIAAGAADDTYAIVIYWEPTANDNDYNLNNGKVSSDGKSLFIDLGVNLVATQDTVESDSFGKDYDADAEYPAVKVSSADELIKALKDGGNIVLDQDIIVNDGLIPVNNDTTINLNDHTINASHNTSRPFVMTDGSSLTINGDDEIVQMGKYGLVNIPADITEATITINGGTYVGKTDYGCMIKARGTGDLTVNLNGVTLMDESDNGSWAVNGADYYGGNLTVNVNGGEYTCFNGFNCAQHLTLTNVVMNIKHRAVGGNYAVDPAVVDGCTINIANVGDEQMNHASPNACVYATDNGKIIVKNSTLNNPTGNATAIYTSGGTIELENCKVSGIHTQYHPNGEYPDAAFSTMVDGAVPADISYPNCANGCAIQH